jgi:hypothetical protein
MGFSTDKGNMQETVITHHMSWPGDDFKILKKCDVPCYFSSDQSLIPQADAVVMEVCFFKVNYKKFKLKLIFFV